MERFERLSGIAAPLMEDNIDTDIIFPARFLLITTREGLGRYAFNDRRFSENGDERSAFILNRSPWRNATLLITGANFGSGSSREQAVWTLLGFGIRCIIAPSFSEIFHANCFRNGVLPIILPQDQIVILATEAEAGKCFEVDLVTMTICVEKGYATNFTVTNEQQDALLNGWDETAIILNTMGNAIEQFEAGQRGIMPWFYSVGDAHEQ